MDQPAANDLKSWLQQPLSDALGARFGRIEIYPLPQKNAVPDTTTAMQLRDAVGSPRAVVLCSAPAAPDMIRQAMARAAAAKVALGEAAGEPVLEPLAEGRVQGLSYAVLPYCRPLSDSRLLSWVQRAMLRPTLLQWLRIATARTGHEGEHSAVAHSFADSLRCLATLELDDRSLRVAADRANGRLHSGDWRPMHVLMHGDFWKGNVLIRPAYPDSKGKRWCDRFVIIDWSGSLIDGFAMYDLVRLAQSVRLSPRALRKEVEWHCNSLQCDVVDASSYLMAGLGHVLMNLEHFPIDRYTAMALSCHETLRRVLV